MAERRVGAVGLGLLGSALTASLLEQGIEVVGFDLAAERRDEHARRGGTVAGSVADVAADTDRVLLCMPTSEIAAEVCLGEHGIASTAAAGTIVMDATTARPADSVAIHDGLAGHGISYLDTAVSGNSAMAWERDIAVLAGGDADALETVRPLLEGLARSVHHVGGPGTGARTKLIVNLVLGAHRVVLAEALVLGERSGLELPTLLDVLKDSAAYSAAMDGWGQRMVTGDHEQPASRVRQHAKDVRLILEEGQRAGAPLWMASTVAQVLLVAEQLDLGEADNSAVMEVLRRLASALPQAPATGA